MYCNNCGKKVDEDSKFCVHCGSRLAVSSDNKNEKPNLVSEPKKKKSNLLKIIIILAIIFFGLPMLAAAILVAINPAKRQNQAKDAAIKNDVGLIATELQTYYATSEKYPSSITSLVPKFLTSLPTTPAGSPYGYKTSGGNAVVFAALNDPTVVGNVWCWKSKTGVAQEEAEGTCTQ